MVRAIEDDQEGYKTRLHHLREMHETAGRHTKSLSFEASKALDEDGENGSQTPTESNGRGHRSRKSLEEAAAAAKEAREKQQQSGELINCCK